MRATREAVERIQVFVPVAADPTGPERIGVELGAPKEKGQGVAIGILDNHKAGSAAVLRRLQQRLSERYGDVQFVWAQKPEAGKPAPREALDALAARCQAVVTGIGD